MASSIVLCALLFTIACWRIYVSRNPKHTFPPGPKGVPFVGSLFDINNERPWITYGLWAKEYGDIVMYWVMGKPVVLLGRMEHAENLLQKRMALYGNRPNLVMAQDIVTQNMWYIGTADSTYPTHKKHRRILGERLRANTLRDWAHPVATKEMCIALQKLTQQPEHFARIVKLFTVNVMLNTTFARGSLPSIDDPLIARINQAGDHQFTAQIQGRFWVDHMPFLKFLPSWLPGMSWKAQGLSWREEVDQLYTELWDEAKDRVDRDRPRDPCLVENLLQNQTSQIAKLEGTTIAAAMVDAGTNTLSGTTLVILIVFMYYPQILKKAQNVVDDVVGKDRLPGFDDASRMPYITALIREAFRWRTVAPVAIPHATIRDDLYAGYFIPKGTTVFALSQQIHEDEELYPDHKDFKPERFLDDQGQLNSLPHAGFGFGSRKCLGQHFAEQTLCLVAASIVWAFDVTPPVKDNGESVLPSLNPMDWGASLASPPPENMQAILRKRSDAVSDIIARTMEAWKV